MVLCGRGRLFRTPYNSPSGSPCGHAFGVDGSDDSNLPATDRSLAKRLHRRRPDAAAAGLIADAEALAAYDAGREDVLAAVARLREVEALRAEARSDWRAAGRRWVEAGATEQEFADISSLNSRQSAHYHLTCEPPQEQALSVVSAQNPPSDCGEDLVLSAEAETLVP